MYKEKKRKTQERETTDAHSLRARERGRERVAVERGRVMVERGRGGGWKEGERWWKEYLKVTECEVLNMFSIKTAHPVTRHINLYSVCVVTYF